MIVRRPAGVSVRVRVGQGARRVTLDEQTVAACAGPTTLLSAGYDRATDRFDVSADFADRLTVTTVERSDVARLPTGDVLLAATATSLSGWR
jgi:hypothetical protein